jgi:Domain of unknown function (DUF4296)
MNFNFPVHGLACVVCLVVVACNTGAKPSTPLTDAQMVTVLKNLYVAEHGVREQHRPEDQIALDSLIRPYFYQVLAHHGIDAETFRDAYADYQQHPSYLKKIEERIAADLKTESELVARLHPPIVAPIDSARHAPPDSIRRKVRSALFAPRP